jgi:hypothetical protein
MIDREEHAGDTTIENTVALPTRKIRARFARHAQHNGESVENTKKKKKKKKKKKSHRQK